MTDTLAPRALTGLLQAQNKLETKGYVQLEVSGDLRREMEELHRLLQAALVIEHATIPVYLTMLYTVDATTPAWRVPECLRSVVVEEMLHLALVANVLNALGGRADLDNPDFIPKYPCRLPYDVDSMTLNLFPFSKRGVEQAREIERSGRVRAEAVLRATPRGMTIGEYYAYLESRLRAVVRRHGEENVFVGDPRRQISAAHYYYDGGGDIVPVHDLETAVKALQLIRDQGEGAHMGIWSGNSATLEGKPEIAHYFRFDELLKGRRYREGDTIESGPTGEALDVPWDGARPTAPGTKLADYPQGSAIRATIEAFNRNYCDMLRLLEQAFDGDPDLLVDGVIRMCSMRDSFLQITRNPFPGRPGIFAAPTFEYVGHTQPKPEPKPVTPSKPAPVPPAAVDPNLQTVNRLQDAYSRGDLNAALACMSPDIVWDITGPPQVPYAGVFYGHAGFSDFWRLLGETLQIARAGFQHVLTDGERVVGLGGEQGVIKATGAPYHYDWAVSHEFDANHLITRMRQYYDPDRVRAALARPAASSAPNPSGGSTMTPQTQTVGQALPDIPQSFTLPFYYASLSNVDVYYLVPPERVAPYLDGTGLTAALFEGQAVVSYNFQLYTGHFSAGVNAPVSSWYGSGAGITQELELNIVVYPTARADQVAQVDFQQFILGDEQSKLLGNHRVFVPCDADIAISAGETPVRRAEVQDQLQGQPAVLQSRPHRCSRLRP
jgi:ketosteroid isomerase-like protein